MTNEPRQPRNIPTGDIPRPGVTRSRPGATPLRSTPHTSTSRRRTPGDDLLAISWRLEPRDYVIAHLLSEHRFLTTDQIAAILFTSARTCRNRLNALRRLGFIDWFMPVHPVHGRLPVHWVPGRLSARYVALHHGERPPTPRAVREAQDALVAGGHLDHTDGTNQFFVDLIAHSRNHPDTRLTRWWPSRRIAAAVDHNIRPDGHGVWSEADRQVAFFLEYDTGTEFSGSQCPCRSPDLHVCAAQRLMVGPYLLQQVWCKHVRAVSPGLVLDGRAWTVHGRRCDGDWDRSWDASAACGEFASFSVGKSTVNARRRVVRLAGVIRVWGRCRGRAWGRCGDPS